MSRQNLYPVELKTNASCKTVDTLVKKLEVFFDSKRFFLLQNDDEVVFKLGLPRDPIEKFLHHAAVISVNKFFYTFWVCSKHYLHCIVPF